MSTSLTGKDTTIIAGRVFKDFADADTVVIDIPNNIVEAKVGKNGNTIFAFNSTGKTTNATLRLIRGSADDKFLNNKLNEYLQDPAAFVLLLGEFIKRSGDGQGNITSDIYKMEGGVVQKIPITKENVEGDTEQAVSIYQLIFANTSRIIA